MADEKKPGSGQPQKPQSDQTRIIREGFNDHIPKSNPGDALNKSQDGGSNTGKPNDTDITSWTGPMNKPNNESE